MIQQEQRKQRSDAGILQVTERDLAALSFIGQQYCITFDHLQILLALHSQTSGLDQLSVGATRNALSRWLQLDYIEPPRKFLRDYSLCIWLSRKGLRELQLPYSYYLPNPTSIPHFHAVNALRLQLQQFDPSAQWIGQRSLGLETTLRPLPDAELRRPSFSAIALQVVESVSSSVMLASPINTLLQLASRQTENSFSYAHICYFLHQSAFTPFQSALTSLDAHLQERVRLSQLDAQAFAQDFEVLSC